MDLKHAKISGLHKALLAKEFSAVELTKAYQENLKKNEDLNAFVSLTAEQALSAAEIVDDKIKRGEEISAISGIPSVLKDNYNWTGTKTTASSNILRDYVSPYNATVTQRLLNAGAIFLGKTNMDAFAHGSSTETSDFGVTLNPYNHERVAGGSSGGSGAAVAADISAYGIGSETAGSVRGPAAWCNLYGFAPTFGRNSRYGVVAMGSSLDRPGVLANSVMDCAIVTDVMDGHDELDATSIPEPATSYAKELSNKNTKFRIGLPKQFLDDRIDKQVSKAVMDAVKAYEKLGAEIVELDLIDPKYAIATYTILCRSEISSNLARIDGIRYGYFSETQAETILDQIALNRYEGFGNEARQRSMTGAYTLSAGYYEAYYKKAQQVRTLLIEDFAKAFEKADVIMGPTMPTVAPKLGVSKNNPLFGELADILTEPSALAGLPCISVPVGMDDEGLPIGLQIFAPQFSEQLVLDTAYIYETKINE
jgi:aspartyl-tRNA(Asn)/glutamyl-tRNA(Gln) amidotransferase subunit A